jgi:hypothetical protein
MIKFKADKWDERALAERLSHIVEGDRTWKVKPEAQGSPILDEKGLPPHPRKWTLDWNNNHWLNPRPDEGEGVYHYNHRYWDADEMAALAVVLKWLLGVEILEVTKTSRYPKPETT